MYPEIKRGKVDLFRIVGKTDPVIMVNTIALAKDMEPIQMDVVPADRDLNCIMEIFDSAIAADKQSPPNHGTDPLNPYLYLINKGLLYIYHDPSFFDSILDT
jgi:hypothetical protein